MHNRIVTVYIVALVSHAFFASLGRAQCVGDCNGNGEVTVGEILTMVDIALGSAQPADCTRGDLNLDENITVDEILAAVNNALNGCPTQGTPTPISTPTATSVPTGTPTWWPRVPTPTCLPPFTPAPSERPGDLDTTFGADGIVLTAIGKDADARAVLVQPDGKVAVAGSAITADGPYERFALARYNADGSLDPSFGTNGIVTTSIGNSDAIPHALAWQPDGKLVVAGEASYNFALARYTPDGSLDPGFGTSGIINDARFLGGAAHTIVLQPDGKLVAAGDSYPACAVRRYQTDGAPDPTFGANGATSTSISGIQSCWITALVLQPDGKLVAAGAAYVDDYFRWQFALVRYDADGSLDPSFGTNGIVTTSIGSIGASGLVLRPDGRLVAGGSTYGGAGEADFVLVGYNADGSLDTGFGNGGISSESIGGLTALAIQPDGKLVAAGFNSYAHAQFVLARYNADGSLDPSFGTGGTTFTSLGWYICPNQASAGYGYASALAIQPDRNLIVAGSWNGLNGSGSLSFALARYLGASVSTATPIATPTGTPPTATPTSTTTPTATSTPTPTPTATPTPTPTPTGSLVSTTTPTPTPTPTRTRTRTPTPTGSPPTATPT